MSETEGTVEGTETAPDTTAADQIGTDTVEEPAAGSAVSDAVAEALTDELAEEAIPMPVGPAGGRHAKVYLCDRGHRTVAVWSQPATCHARPTRSGGECGHQVYPIGELPEQVQKALNPLKASKKASKG